MSRGISIVCTLAVLLLAGCHPVLDSLDPNPVGRLQSFKAEGDRMAGATIYIDGTPVGAALVPALSDPLKRRDVVAPSAVGLYSIHAQDLIGSSATKALTVVAAPVPAANYGIAAVIGTSALGVHFIIHGDGVYPGAGPGAGPFAGPLQAQAVGGGVFPATSTMFLWDRTFRISFDPGVLPAGTYKIRITNAPIYGGGGPIDSQGPPVAVLP